MGSRLSAKGLGKGLALDDNLMLFTFKNHSDIWIIKENVLIFYCGHIRRYGIKLTEYRDTPGIWEDIIIMTS